MKKSTKKFLQVMSAFFFLLIAETAVSTEDENLKQLTKPRSTINFGAGYLANDNARFGQYTGIRNEGPYGLFNIDITKRDENTGTWLKLLGRNLGLQNRDVRFEHNKQGHWSYFRAPLKIPKKIDQLNSEDDFSRFSTFFYPIIRFFLNSS